MPQNFTLYAVHGLGQAWDEDPFDMKRLPFDLGQGVTIEDVSSLLQKTDAFSEHVTTQMGTRAVESLKAIRYALVHRYERVPIVVEGQVVGESGQNVDSAFLVRNVAACLRLIRPMRQDAAAMYGQIRENGSFDIHGFDHPFNVLETPQNQKHFLLRTRDAEELKVLLPEFLRAMGGEFWKFRMAVQFHELGHFQHRDKKARYLLWSSAIESVYTSHDWEHQGGLVAKERIKWFLGENTTLYPKGELLSFDKDPNLTVGKIVDDLYSMRNFLAHGDKLGDQFLKDTLRDGINGKVIVQEVLFEAQSSIIRTSLLKILRDGLLDHFADAARSQGYFGAQHLTRSELLKVKKAKP